ncbi:MAG: PAS domain-containing sensor histidine kinase [Chthoniobacteraceae bacterium]
MNLDLLRKQPRWAINLEALLMVCVIGYTDYAAGYDVSMFAFYSLPILYTVWFSGRAARIGACVACTISWGIADISAGHPYTDVWIFVWNTMVQFSVFVAAMVGGEAIKNQIERSHRRVVELERFHILAQISPVGIFRADSEGACVFVNQRWCKITGLGEEGALGRRWTDALHPDDKDRIAADAARAAREKHAIEFDGRFLRADGSVAWAHGCVAPELDGETGAHGYVGAVMDVSEHRRLECEILEIGEREQQRIGQDLHDDLCQFLAAIQYTAASLVTDLQRNSVPEAVEARDVSDLLKDAVQRARDLARGIFPVQLEQGGLVSALYEFAANSSRAFDVDCVLRCDQPINIPDRSAASHLYRIAQEALHNAVRHGRARQVILSLFQENDWITLTVEDNGVGIPADSRDNQRGMGLRIMEYRSHMIGGSLKIERPPHGGTLVACSFHKQSRPTARKASSMTLAL